MSQKPAQRQEGTSVVPPYPLSGYTVTALHRQRISRIKTRFLVILAQCQILRLLNKSYFDHLESELCISMGSSGQCYNLDGNLEFVLLLSSID